ncbi:MAG: ABC transporter permease [Candidatus Latescibacteria bacterium]|nr:ABC transporter permease [Candidatus Latescibacterota bacterium]NIM22396.1 ABC transporter permease [Candidatus Latescibacterota bacterium]NIM64756.1 ABC transporter permease [Candidatus Latescibacterota bacterium]NIO01267.1 ABC transporter permease [Candidatus Latescibacterota bacterium]NIO27759.1 ABC transporter permease [Candidatus Latescibacterota bacterium]
MTRTILTILWKDLKIELRTKEAFSASFVFCIIVLVIFNFTLDLTTEEALRLGPGFLWVAFAFAGVLSLNRSFALEKEEGCAQALMLAPVDRGAIYVGKLLANVIFMLVTEIIILPLFVVFFNLDLGGKIPPLLLIFFLGTVGFASVGTIFSAIAANTRMREVMLPILLLPITIPVLIAAVETTAYAMGVRDEASFWFRLLIAYDVVFTVASFLAFEYVVEE